MLALVLWANRLLKRPKTGHAQSNVSISLTEVQVARLWLVTAMSIFICNRPRNYYKLSFFAFYFTFRQTVAHIRLIHCVPQ